MKVLTVVGARPQLIKAAPLSRALRAAGHEEILVDTGQHYDREMSELFFDELGLPRPRFSLGVGSMTRGRQIAKMLTGLEEAVAKAKPNWVLVYGDTNSTLAGALAAEVCGVPLAHVEAGLRSFNREMPEESNRVLTDHLAHLLLCPTQTAVTNLAREGISRGVHLVGDPSFDAIRRFQPKARETSSILKRLDLKKGGFALATLHRPSNVDRPKSLKSIFDALAKLEMPVLLPLHPRTRAALERNPISTGGSLRMIEALGFLDMLTLEENAALILTDSGGVQKEAFYFGVPCITVREETEWVETVVSGWNILAGPEEIATIIQEKVWPSRPGRIPYPGPAAPRIVDELEKAGR